MAQKIINVDSQILSSIQACEERTNLHFIRNIRPQTKSSALEKGELIHLPLEIYYSLYGKVADLESPTFTDLIEAGISSKHSLSALMQQGFANRRVTIIDLAIQYARYKSIKMNIAMDECENVIYQFGQYCDFYKNENLKPLAVESVGSRILYEDPDIKILYTFKIDLVSDIDDKTYPVDHKSSSRKQDPTSMSNQFIGYCFGTNTNWLIVNTIGFQKTLSPKERFQRVILPISNERIEEWRLNSVFHIKRWTKTMESGYFPKRYTSCKGQFACDYLHICEQDPSARDYVIERDYSIGTKWDPSELLLTKRNDF